MRVAITTSYGYWGAIGPDSLFRPGSNSMVGGGETALFWLARALTQLPDTRVDLFYDTARPGHYDSIDIYPKSLAEPMLRSADYDLLIAWEDPFIISTNHRARKVIYAVQCNHLGLGVLQHGVDAIQCVSNWHVNQLRRVEYDPTIEPERFFTIPNGVDLRRYDPAINPPDEERDPFRVIHSSSPDRGLHHLLELWPRVKKRFPKANLHVYYDMAKWFGIVDQMASYGQPVITGDLAGRIRKALAATEGMDVVLHGGVGQWELARAQQSARLMCYPCDPVQPTEGWSISVLEALAAGTPVVTTNADAFPELWAGITTQVPLPINPDELFDEISGMLSHSGRRGLDADEWLAWSEAGKEFAKWYSWDLIGQQYRAAVLDILAGRRPDTAALSGASE